MPEESHPLVELAGSERAPLAAAVPAGQLDTSERAELTLVLRRRAELPAGIVEGPTVLTSEQLAEQYGADPADADLVRQTLTGLGLEITAVHPASRRIKVTGTLGQLSSAFGTTLQQVSSPAPQGHGTVTHRYREGPLFVPAPLDGVVLAVLGLDTRPQARPHFRARDAAAAPGDTYPPNQVADIYQFPAGTTGAGQTIAVIGVLPRAGGSPGSSGSSGGAGGRGVPDVAGNADPATGYQIYSGGQARVVGGTSAVAPLWAALVSRLAEATGQRFGLVQTLLYAGVAPGVSVAGFRDITSGNNGAYTAGPGWDACSGLGSPDGTALLNRLQG